MFQPEWPKINAQCSFKTRFCPMFQAAPQTTQAATKAMTTQARLKNSKAAQKKTVCH